MEDVLKELDEKLGNFVKVKKEVWDFHKEVKRKYQTLSLLEIQEVTSIIEKFKALHLGIILTQG